MGRMPEVIAHAATKTYNTSPGVSNTVKIKKKIPKRKSTSSNAYTKEMIEAARARQQNNYLSTTAHAKAAQRRSYASYENAAKSSNVGPHASKSARVQRRGQAEMNYMTNRSDAQKFADDVRQNVKLSKNVPSQNPTAGGGSSVTTGKERPGHKYVKKVRTKSGKIRYVYDDSVTTASGKHANANSAFESQRHGKHVSNKNAYMNAWKRREQSENAQRARNADPVRQVQNFAKRTMRSISSAGSGAIDAARGFLKQFGIG